LNVVQDAKKGLVLFFIVGVLQYLSKLLLSIANRTLL